MIITGVNEANQSAFERLMPEEQFLSLRYPSVFALGAIWEEGEEKIPAGTLVFSVDEGTTDEGEEMITARILWFFISPEYRRRNLADGLMEQFFDVMDESGVEYAVCDVPMPEEYNLLCAYLEAWGFRIGLIDKYDLTVELGDLFRKKEFQKEPAAVPTPLKDVSQDDFSRFLKSALELPGVWQDLPLLTQEYETSVSCVYTEKNRSKIESALLVQYVGNDTLEVVLLRSLSNRPALLIDLIRYALRAAKKIYTADTNVRVVCRSEATAALVGGIFPDAEPLLVRRCCYYSGEDTEAEEEEGGGRNNLCVMDRIWRQEGSREAS
ncbi:MAG: GNAT family N-acetyltransferase [Lachnospiraceae bacterium]|nr:GNAT family N-acetyltransferase [Lachnospiraceae bacterium]